MVTPNPWKTWKLGTCDPRKYNRENPVYLLFSKIFIWWKFPHIWYYNINLLYTLVYCLMKWTLGKCTKKVSINKHQVKAAYFKLIHLWKCSPNQWRHCKIVSFCVNALDLWCPCNMQQYISTDKFFGTELKYEVLLFLQRNDDGCRTSYDQISTGN